MHTDMPEGPLYCVCKQPYDPDSFYIGCDGCEDWFHGSCIGIIPSEAQRLANYFCSKCRSEHLNEAKFQRARSKLSLRKRPHDIAHITNETPVISAASDVLKREQEVRPPYVGLPNPNGDLCYLNSVVQALAHSLKHAGFENKLLISNKMSEVAQTFFSLLRGIAESNSLLSGSAATNNMPLLHALALAREIRANFVGRFTPGND